jgi:WD40 repeat protein
LTHEGFRSDVERLVAALEEAMADIHRPQKAGPSPKADKKPEDTPLEKERAVSLSADGAAMGDASVKKTGRARGQKKAAAGTTADAGSSKSVDRPAMKDGNKAGAVPGKTPAEVQAWQREQQEKDEKFKLARLKAAEENARMRAENQPPAPPPINPGLKAADTRTPEPEAVRPGPEIIETPSRVSRRVVLGGAIVGVAAAAWFTRGSWLPGGGEVRTIKDPIRIVSDQLMIHDVDFDPLGQSFVTGGEQGNVTIWSSRGAYDFELDGHTDRITKTVFSPVRDRRRLLTLSVDGKAFVRSGERYQDAIPLLGDAPTLAAGWRRYGSHVAIGGSDVTVWDAQTGKLVSTIEAHRGPILDLAYASWGDVLATASEDGTAQLWDAVGFGHFATLNAEAGPVFAVVVSPADGHFATLAKGNKTTIWSWGRIGALTSVTLDTRKEIVAAEFSPDGLQLATAALDGTADLWRVTGEHVATLAGHTGPLTSARFSPDGALILTTSWDKTARLWNRETQANVAVLTGHSGTVTDARFSYDGTYALTRSDDLSARVWKVPNGLIA